ncbi:MAG: hypothetical protein CAF45_001325 [Nitrospira sp. CG24E]|nr:MAG: hypothetical protein CAF45_001325 [Nitrospira sp. CG24E]
MSVIWGHVELVVNRSETLPILILNTRISLGIRHTQCNVGVGARILKGFERVNLDQIHRGDFVVVTLAEHTGCLEAERIEVIIFQKDPVMGVGEG